MSQNNGYPVGLRELMVVPITSLATPTYGTGVVSSAAESAEFDTEVDDAMLKGNDKVVAYHTLLRNGTFKFSVGGIPQAWLKVVDGNTATDSGSAPNDLTYRAIKTSTCLPYFGWIARAVGPSCGQAGDPADSVVVAYKAKLKKPAGGKLAEGAFAMAEMDGLVLPSPYDSDTLFLVFHRGTAAALSTTWPGSGPFLS